MIFLVWSASFSNVHPVTPFMLILCALLSPLPPSQTICITRFLHLTFLVMVVDWSLRDIQRREKIYCCRMLMGSGGQSETPAACRSTVGLITHPFSASDLTAAAVIPLSGDAPLSLPQLSIFHERLSLVTTVMHV